MNLPIPSLRAAVSRYLRVRVSGPRDWLRAMVAETQPQRPEHGGLEGATGTENTAFEEEEQMRRRQRAATLAAIANHLGLSSEVDLDIEVVNQNGRLHFAIRDKASDVHVLLDEADAEKIVEKIRNVSGGLVDRSI